MSNYLGTLSPYSKERALILDRNLFTYSPHVEGLFGETAYCNPTQLGKLDIKQIAKEGFRRIVFANPYRNDALRGLYEEARREKFPLLICERGALPGTVCLDESGFLSDSIAFDANEIHASYSTTPMALPQLRKDYFSRRVLETQSAGSGVSIVELEQRIKLKHPTRKPRVLIVLQDSADTAVRFFRHQEQDYQSFKNFAEELCLRFQGQVDFSFKPHPREREAIIKGADNVSHLHILDALTSSDHVICFSSGVGVLAMLMEKPVGYYGLPFYRHSGAAFHVSNTGQFETLLSLDAKKHVDDAGKFLSHLQRVYSDADFFGSSYNPISNRDYGCSYRTIRLKTAQGYFEKNVRQSSSILMAADGVRQVTKRIFCNKFSCGYYRFSEIW